MSWPGQDRQGQNGTFVLKSTGGLSQPDVSPCIGISLKMLTDLYLGAPTHRYPDEEAAALAADERADRPLDPGAEIELINPVQKKIWSSVGTIALWQVQCLTLFTTKKQ